MARPGPRISPYTTLMRYKYPVTLNPLLGANGVDEWKEALEKNYKGEYSDYKLEETTIHGYKALICQYDDWGCVVKVVIDFGNDAIPNGYYGIQFDINGEIFKRYFRIVRCALE